MWEIYAQHIESATVWLIEDLAWAGSGMHDVVHGLSFGKLDASICHSLSSYGAKHSPMGGALSKMKGCDWKQYVGVLGQHVRQVKPINM